MIFYPLEQILLILINKLGSKSGNFLLRGGGPIAPMALPLKPSIYTICLFLIKMCHQSFLLSLFCSPYFKVCLPVKKIKNKGKFILYLLLIFSIASTLLFFSYLRHFPSLRVRVLWTRINSSASRLYKRLAFSHLDSSLAFYELLNNIFVLCFVTELPHSSSLKLCLLLCVCFVIEAVYVSFSQIIRLTIATKLERTVKKAKKIDFCFCFICR